MVAIRKNAKGVIGFSITISCAASVFRSYPLSLYLHSKWILLPCASPSGTPTTPNTTPAHGSASAGSTKSPTKYLERQACNVYVLTEANAAMQLAGYQAQFSAESPYLKQSRNYGPPNRYQSAGIYSRRDWKRCPSPSR